MQRCKESSLNITGRKLHNFDVFGSVVLFHYNLLDTVGELGYDILRNLNRGSGRLF